MSLLDFFFPKKCLGCGRTGTYFCSQCLNLASVDTERICPVCERPSLDGWTHPACRRPQNLDGLTSVFRYQGLIKKAIVKLKYRFVTNLAEELVELFLSLAGEDRQLRSLCRQKPTLVPIALHASRERWRGFNQSALLGEIIAKNFGLGFEPALLIRVKKTRPQMELKERERKENIRGAFALSPNLLISQSPNILLFDDVWTSGATLKEAGKVLKQNGAKLVWGLTLAR